MKCLNQGDDGSIWPEETKAISRPRLNVTNGSHLGRDEYHRNS